MDGRTITYKVDQTWPNQFVETQYYGDNRVTTITRTFNKDHMAVILVAGDVTASSTFARQLDSNHKEDWNEVDNLVT
jgi:hypothetical protein